MDKTLFLETKQPFRILGALVAVAHATATLSGVHTNHTIHNREKRGERVKLLVT